jgi:hypothetical protein
MQKEGQAGAAGEEPQKRLQKSIFIPFMVKIH